MADVVDTMFGWLVDIFGWIFEKILQLIGWLIKVVFKGIASLFKAIVHAFKSPSKDSPTVIETPINNPDALNEPFTYDSDPSVAEETPQMRSYEDLSNDIKAITKDNDGETAASDKLTQMIMTVLIHNTMSVHQKGELIVAVNNKAHEVFPDVLQVGQFYASVIETSYKLLNQMTQGFFTKDLEDFYAAINQSNTDSGLKPLADYLIDIMAAFGAINSPTGKFSVTEEMTEGIEFPEWGK